MDNYIQQLNNDVAKAYHLAATMLEATPCYEHILALHGFFMQYQHTNTLIDYAECAIKSGKGLPSLFIEAKTLLQLTENFQKLYSDNKAAFDAVDNDKLLRCHLQPLVDEKNEEIRTATPLYQEYRSTSNRMDFMEPDSEQYVELERQCEKAKLEYDIHHARIEELHKAYEDELGKCCKALQFKVEDFALLCYYMHGIAKSIIDIDSQTEGKRI